MEFKMGSTLVRPGHGLGERVDVVGRDGEPLRPRRVPVYDELAYLEALARVVPEAREREVPVCRLLGELPRLVHADPLSLHVLVVLAVPVAVH